MINKKYSRVTLQYFNGKEWIFVSEWVNETLAWVSLGDDDFNYRTVDENGEVLTDKSGTRFKKYNQPKINPTSMSKEIDKIFDGIINKLDPVIIDEKESYKRGYDCGLNGSNDWNCHFKIFCTESNTKAWDKGVADAKNKKQ